MKINCLVIDDEPLAREGLAQYVQDLDFLHLIAQCESPLEAEAWLEQADLIFLDVQMPKLNGIDFLKSLRQPPLVVLTTAYPQYALEGYQLDVLDYLLKPITFDRFYQSAQKAKAQWQLRQAQPTAAPDDYFFIKVEHKYEKIAVSEILWVEAMQNYVMIHTPHQKHMTLLTLKSVAERLPAAQFIQTHKSFIVAKNKITSLEGNQIFVGSQMVPISRGYRDKVIDELVSQNLLKR